MNLLYNTLVKCTGIIVEYNPFHNGHRYHIGEARRLTDPDLLIACMSGPFTQRGDISIIDKYEKTKAALDNGVDLIIELPFIHTVQNAYVFGKQAVSCLDRMGADTLVFGSETNNLEELKKYAELEVDVTRLKQLMHDGNSYPKSYGLLSGSLYPNDMLAVAYLKATKYTGMIPVSIQRTNDFHSKELDLICSASAIRKAVQEGRDVSSCTPVAIEEPLFNKDLYPYIRRLLFTMDREELSEIFLVSEGIENLLKENAVRYDDYESFMEASISRRYTRSRIQRILVHIACHIRKKDVETLPEADFIRVLGFNEKGRSYLKQMKENMNPVTLFKQIPEPYKQLQWKAELLYASYKKDPQNYIRRCLQGPEIKM